MLLLLLVLGALLGGGQACAPGKEQAEKKLLQQLGITPSDRTGDLLNNNLFDKGEFFVQQASELDCDFSRPADCAWSNMDNTTNPAIDIEEFFLFEKTEKKRFPAAVGPAGLTRTPEIGDRFIVSGGEGPKATYSVWYSKPLKCMKKGGTLSFTYFVYGATKVRVMLLDPMNQQVLWQSDGAQCTVSRPSDGLCAVQLPAQDEPFHLAIQGFDYLNSLLIVDNIKFESDLGWECGEDIFEFGTTHWPYASGATGDAIEDASDLNCDSFDECRYATTGNKFDVHTEVGNTEQWAEIMDTDETPDGEFAMAKASDGFAALNADQIACQQGDGTLSFRAWQSAGMVLRVCLNDVGTEVPKKCYPVPRDVVSHKITIEGPLKHTQINFVADGWDGGEGGVVAIDDITYDAAICIDFGTEGSELQSGATGQPISDPSDLQCDDFNNCRWSNTGEGQAWQVHNGELHPDTWKKVTGSDQMPEPPFLMVFPDASGPSVLSSDPIDCQADDATLTFDLWTSENTAVSVCAMSTQSPRRSLFCKDLSRSANPSQTVTIPGNLKQFTIDIVAEQGEGEGASMAAIDNINYDAPLCFDVGSYGVPLIADGRTGEHIDRPSDLQCDSNFGSCRWGNGPDEEQTSWQQHTATAVEQDKWTAATGTSKLPDGQFVLVNPAADSASTYESDPIECQSAEGALSFDLWKDAGSSVMVCVQPTEEAVGTDGIKCSTVDTASGQRATVPIEGPLKHFKISILAENINEKPGLVALDNIEYKAHLCTDIGTEVSELSSSATGEPVERTGDLSCPDFENCRWSDADNEGEPWQRHRGQVDANKWQQLMGTSQTPGNDFLMIYPSSTPSSLDSDPIECQNGQGTFKFRGWASSPRVLVGVCVRDSDTNELLRPCVQVPNMSDNSDPQRSVAIPGPLDNFYLQLNVESDGEPEKSTAFVIEDIEYDAALCHELSDFGTTESELTGSDNTLTITDGEELQCDEFDEDCRWRNLNGNGPQWKVHEGEVDADQWERVTGSGVVPEGRFIMVHGKEGQAILASDLIGCQDGPATLTFKAWMSEGMNMRVCVLDLDGLQLQDCVPVPRKPDPVNQVTIDVPKHTEFKIHIIADGWNNGLGGMAALDDIEYDGTVCDPPQPKGTVEECETVQCDFEDDEDCQYVLEHDKEQNVTFNQGEGQQFSVQSGIFGNRVTGVLGAGTGEKYIAVYLRDGQHASIRVGTDLAFDRVITFKHYEATANMQFKICCDQECPFESNPDISVSDRGRWAHSRILCPAGTKAMEFQCINFEGSQNQGACAIDDIRLWRTQADYEFNAIVGRKDIEEDELLQGLLPACKARQLAQLRTARRLRALKARLNGSR